MKIRRWFSHNYLIYNINSASLIMFKSNPAQSLTVRERYVKTLGLLIVLLVSYGSLRAQTASVCSGGTFNYLQPGAPQGTTYTWDPPTILPAAASISGSFGQPSPQSSVSQVLVNNTTSPATATYNVTTSNGNTFLLTVTVNPLPELSSSATPASVCSNASFTYTPTSSTAGASYVWSRLAVGGISNTGNQGAGNINEILLNTTINPITVVYTYTVTANGCQKANQDVSVVINPIPFLTSSLTPTQICSGTFFNYTPTSDNANTFSWSRAARAGVNGGAGNTGPGTSVPAISELLTNSTLLTQTVTYTYTLSNNTLACSNNIQTIQVNVNPVAVVSTQSISSCSGNNFISSPVNVPEGTMYTWTNPVRLNSSAQLSGGSAVATKQFFISQPLSNAGATDETMRYTVTPTSGGCTGTDFFVDVNVLANTPAGSKGELDVPFPGGICSGASFTYTPNSSNTPATYAWKRFYNSAINQAPTSGNGSVSDPLTNNSNIQTTAYYAFTATAANGCTNTQQVTVAVNPPTVLNNSTTAQPICSNTTFNFVPSSNTAGTTFSWSRPAVTGIANPTSSSSVSNPQEVLVNTTNAPITVTYNYFLSTPNGCTNNQAVTVAVNPTPKLSSTLTPSSVCSGTLFTYTATSPTAGFVSFNWSRAIVPYISNGPGSGSGTNISETLVDTSVNPVTVLYNYTTTANGCSNTEVVTLLVKAAPRITNQTVTTCSGTTVSLGTLNVPTGTLYSWSAPTITPNSTVISGATTGTNQTSFGQILSNTTLNPGYARYNVSSSAGGCSGGIFTVDATVNPVPSVGNQNIAPVCSGVSFSYASGNVPTGTTYTWSSPVQSPLNSITGASAQQIGQSTVSQLLSSTNNITNTATYTVTPSSNSCVGNTFTLAVTINPVPAIDNITETICSTGSFSVAPSSVPSNTTYTWGAPVTFPFGSVVGSSPQVFPSSTISQVLVNSTNSTGQAEYTITPQSGSCTGPSFKVTVIVGVPLPFMPDQVAQICSGTSFDVTPSSSRAGTTYTWSVPVVTPAGSAMGSSAASSPQSIISQKLDNLLDIADTVVYNILPYNTGCRGNIFKATIRVLPLPKATITARPVICRNPFDTVSVSFTGTGPWSFSYLNDNVPGTVSGITSSPYKWAVAAIPNIPSRQLTINSIKDIGCTNTTLPAVYVQKVNPLPNVVINSLHGIYICNNILDTMVAVSLRASDTLSYQWTKNGSPILNAVKDSIVVSQNGRYNINLVNQYGCVDTASSPVPISVIAQPVLKIAYDSYCVDRKIQFTNLTDTANIGPTKWLWEFGDTTSSALFNPSHVYARAGDHHLRLTASQNYCAGYTTIAEGILKIQAPIAGVTMPSVSTYKGQVTPLAVRNLPNYRYQWNPSRGLDRPDTSVTNFNLSATQQYAVSLISEGGCVTTDSLMVRVFDDGIQNIFVPKSFTPNNDGINDKLYPYLSGIKEFKYFKVFNRLGKVLFESTNPDAGWDGAFNGVAQPMGIYLWYSVGTALDGTVVENKGQVLILR